jgi:hypothetical protein
MEADMPDQPINDQRSPVVDRALVLLRNADHSWSTMTGQLHTWYDERLLDRGRARYHGMAQGQMAANATAPDLPIVETRHRFWATASPWRVRMERLLDSNPGATSYDVTIIAGTMWWVESDDEVLAGDAAAMIGTYNLDFLLRPSRLAWGIHFRDAGETSIAGRPAIRLQGIPTSDLTNEAPGLVVLRASEQVVTIDATLGIVRKREVFIDGQLAMREELSDLAIDTPVASTLFAPRRDRPMALARERWASFPGGNGQS